ncbi:MAG TPA: lasso peptide biosynthesis B2 protein, partial [Hyphomicrobiaceae bacterium]|nr:lasso peptide biosynthesis B2 protein [Hyphomicrobiaceae bacterium]
RVKRATRRPWLMRDRPCLRQGLLAMRFLRLAGYRPVLHFAIDRTSVSRDVLSAHCWVSLDGEVLLNPATPSMVEILSYVEDRLVPSAPSSAVSPA